MISIIICSVNPVYAEAVKLNIAETVGLPYELIITDNRGSSKGICQVYNEAAERAQYPVLCFIHEDIRFQTENWGKLLHAHFDALPETGVIGIAGSVFKPKALSSWWQEPVNGFEPKRCRLIQHFKFAPIQPNYTYYNPLNETLAEVIALDGLFLSMQKVTWQQSPFDQEMLKGFHGYDLDICLSVSAFKRNYAVFDILVDHLSEGRNDEAWLLETFKVHAKHQSLLPAIVEEYKYAGIDFSISDRHWHASWLREMVSWSLPFKKVKDYYSRILTESGYFPAASEINRNVLQAFLNRFSDSVAGAGNKFIIRFRNGLKRVGI